MKNSPGARAALCALTTLLLTACSPTPAPGPSASIPSTATVGPTTPPTPTPTWSPDQAAAIESVDDFYAVAERIASDPGLFTKEEMTKLLGASLGGDMLDSNVGAFVAMKRKGYREVGAVVVLSSMASRVEDNGRGPEVHVTRCQDQSDVMVLDASGNRVTDEDYQYPAFNLRQFTVRKAPGDDRFKVFGAMTANGTCP